MIAEYRILFLKIREMVGYTQGHNDHADLQKARIKNDEKDVQATVHLILNNWIDPFLSTEQPLVSISAGAVPLPQIAQDLARAYLVGEVADLDFKRERLEPDNSEVPRYFIEAKITYIRQSDENKAVNDNQGR